ncbi:MAG: hypothetical protein ACYTGL_04040 [Planctomycetota bacterium]|jgi:hypothetical protein
MQVYETHGVRFEYPDGWEISIDESEGQTAVTVEGPGTAFWTLSLISERPPAEEIIESALQCFEEEYSNVDVYEVDDRICLLPTIARNLDVISLDLVSKVGLRVCETDEFSIFTMYQLAETETESTERALQAINASLTWESDDHETSTGDPFEFDNLFGGAE